jgi:uncharacterized membrane protein YqgA involved in biofilm formation
MPIYGGIAAGMKKNAFILLSASVLFVFIAAVNFTGHEQVSDKTGDR